MNIQFDPWVPGFYDDPRPTYKALRDYAPVFWSERPKLWAISRYEDVRSVVTNWKVFSNVGSFVIGVGHLFKPNLMMMDPPKHTKLRKIFSGILTRDRFAAMESMVRDRVVELLAPLEGQKQADLMQPFATQLPGRVIGDLMGIPKQDIGALMKAVNFLSDYSDSEADMEANTRAGVQKLDGYYEEYFREREKRGAGDDVVWRVIAAERDGTLTHKEAIGFATQLTIAGGETSINLIGNMVYWLFKNQSQKKLLMGDPSLIANAVEESLRYDSSVHMLNRVMAEDFEFHGQKMKRGDVVGVLFNSANNDERKFADPDTFDITRDERVLREHIAFGGGPHACIGGPLARLEAKVAYQEILKRWPNHTVVESDIVRYSNPFIRGFKVLPLRLQ